MNPERLSRDAIRVVDRLEAKQVQRLKQLVDEIARDARDRLGALDLTDASVARAIREVQIRRLLQGSAAARRLLDMGTSGPLADAMRADIMTAYREGLRTAGNAVAASTTAAGATVGAAAAFGARIDLELIQAITESTLTTLNRVGRDGLERLERTIVRVAARGAGPRAGARAVMEATGVTRVEAERITRTVLQRANSEARKRGYEASGVEYVRYDATNDSRTCPYCAARHGMVYRIDRAPSLPLHPSCRCVTLPFRPDASAEDRADEYYERTRRDLREREVITTRATGGRRESSRREAETTTATAAAPFERTDGREPPRPVWAPGRGWL